MLLVDLAQPPHVEGAGINLFMPHSRSGRAHALESYAALWPPITSSGLAFLMLPRRYLYSLTLTRCEAGSRRETRAQVMPLRLPPFGCCGLSALLAHNDFLHWLIFTTPYCRHPVPPRFRRMVLSRAVRLHYSANHPSLHMPWAATSWAFCLFTA